VGGEKEVHFSYIFKTNTAATVTTAPTATLALLQLPLFPSVSFALRKIKDTLHSIDSLDFIS